MVWKYALNKFDKKKKEPLLSIIGDWLEPFVFTVSSKSLRRCWPIRRTSDGHLPAFSRSMLDLSLSPPTDLSIFPPLLPHARSFPPVSLLFSSGAKPDWFPPPLIYILDVGIDQPPLYHDKTCTPRFIAVPHYGTIHQRVVLPASIAIQIGANRRWLSLLMTLKNWNRACSIFRTFHVDG